MDMEKRNRPAPWLGEYEKVQRAAHPTKKGPGRRHKEGQPHGSARKATKGAGAGFVQHTNPKRNAERKLAQQAKRLARAS
jgi:hypothetical protein